MKLKKWQGHLHLYVLINQFGKNLEWQYWWTRIQEINDESNFSFLLQVLCTDDSVKKKKIMVPIIIHPAFMLLHTKLIRNIILNWFLQTTTASFVYPACWTENKHSNSNILYLNSIGFKAQSLWGRVQIKLIKSNLIKCRFEKREENRSTRGKTSQSRDKLNPHMTPSLEIEPGTHWWEASAFERSRLTLW